MPADQLLAWGWRVPFLVVWPTAGLGLLLRLWMPEPTEFVQAKAERKQRLDAALAAAAAAKAARSGPSASGGSAVTACSRAPSAASGRSMLGTLRVSSVLSVISEAAEHGTVQSLKARLMATPLVYLLVNCWRQVLLHALGVGWEATAFYSFTSW
jgi:hypothetical protein